MFVINETHLLPIEMEFRSDLSSLWCRNLHDHFFRFDATFNEVNFRLVFCVIDLLNTFDNVIRIILSTLKTI